MQLNSLHFYSTLCLWAVSLRHEALDIQLLIHQLRSGSFDPRFAFQYNPALQPRAIIVFGCISKTVTDSEVKQLLKIMMKASLEAHTFVLINFLSIFITLFFAIFPSIPLYLIMKCYLLVLSVNLYRQVKCYKLSFLMCLA